MIVYSAARQRTERSCSIIQKHSGSLFSNTYFKLRLLVAVAHLTMHFAGNCSGKATGKWNINIDSVKIITSFYPVNPYLPGKNYPIKCYKFIFCSMSKNIPETPYPG